MDHQIQKYLFGLARRLKLDPRTKDNILKELQSHIEERAGELERDGLPSTQAYRRATQELGRPDLLADDLYAVHSRGTWMEVLLAALPHLLLAALFAMHIWNNYLVLLVAIPSVSFIAYKGWRSGRAKWAYSWLGYSLAAPAISWLFSLFALGYAAWTFVTTGVLPFGVPLFILLVAYVPFSLWLLARVTRGVVKRDWLMASLTALPFPFLTSWILFLNWQGGFWAGSPRVQETDGDRALIFLAMALTTAVFFKVGRRALQIGLLTASTALLVVYTTVAIPISFGFLAAILILLSSIAFLLSPAFLEARFRKRRPAVDDADAKEEVVTHWFSSVA